MLAVLKITPPVVQFCIIGETTFTLWQYSNVVYSIYRCVSRDFAFIEACYIILLAAKLNA